MPTELIIENVPDELVARLAIRALINERSLEDELLAILEQAVRVPAPPDDSR
jgi:plasmid stability protein